MVRRPTGREALWLAAMVYTVAALTAVAISQSWFTLLFMAPLAIYGLFEVVREIVGYPGALVRFARRRFADRFARPS